MLAGQIGVHPPVRANADTKCSGRPARTYLEVVQDEPVSVRQPRVRDDRFAPHDHVACLHLTVDDEATERASASSHLLSKSVRRSVRRTPCSS
jgi:hypothetical protein